MTTFELIKDRLDWMHDVDGYCVEYTVTYWQADWSTGKYWIVTGLLSSGSEVDLGTFEAYRSDYKWLADCVGVHSA